MYANLLRAGAVLPPRGRDQRKRVNQFHRGP